MSKRASVLLAAWLVAAVLPVAAQRSIQIQGESQSYLGVQIRDINAQEFQDLRLSREAGAFVVGVHPESPAEEAGLREGDVLIQFASQPVWSVAQLQRLVSETPPGREVELVWVRDGQTLQRRTAIGERRLSGGSGTFPARPGIPGLGPTVPRGFDFQFQPGTRPRGRARLGIRGEELTEQMAETLDVPGRQGVLVMEVVEESAAEEAGLQAGDVIISVGGQAVRALSDIAELLEPGPVELEVVRQGEVLKLTVDLTPEEQESPGRLRL